MVHVLSVLVFGVWCMCLCVLVYGSCLYLRVWYVVHVFLRMVYAQVQVYVYGVWCLCMFICMVYVQVQVYVCGVCAGVVQVYVYGVYGFLCVVYVQPHPIWGHRSKAIVEQLLRDGWACE